MIVTTGTASGKSLAFNLPVLDAIAREPKTRALYLYPTKALAQDQARSLARFRLEGLRPAIYDGDTETERRGQIRRWANVILTNPDMLHVGILPHHDRWGDVLHNLRYVVVDEAHVYRGVFGSHVGNVLRRLRRLARAYGAEPQFLLASATIANPGELALALTGQAATVVETDTSAQAERDVVLWNPALLDPELGVPRQRALGGVAPDGRARLARPAHDLLREEPQGGRADPPLHRRSRRHRDRGAPRALPRRLHARAAARDRAAPDGGRAARRLGDGRARARHRHRRELDCAISVGFPGTVASLRQQWGRAGRRGHGLAVLVASEDALDQYFMREPEALLDRRVEAAILDHASPRILDPHVYAAAYEAPLDAADSGDARPRGSRAGGATPGARADAGRLRLEGSRLPGGADLAPLGRRRGVHDRRHGRPAPCSGSSSASAPTRRSTTAPSTSTSASSTSSRSSITRRASRSSTVRPSTGTRRSRRTRRPRSRRRSAPTRVAGVELHFGRVSVTEQVVAYQRKAIADGSTLETVPLDLPETTFETEAVWFCPDSRLLEGLEEMPKLLGTLHAAEHALIALLPLWAMCDRWDIGGLSTNLHFQTGLPTVFVYDGHAGGVGITERGFEQFEGWVADTARLIAGCPCHDGCPSCVQSPKCGNLNEHARQGGRGAARTMLLVSEWREIGTASGGLPVDFLGASPPFVVMVTICGPTRREGRHRFVEFDGTGRTPT